MKHSASNVMVGLFVLVGLSGLGWLIFKFGDLPTWIRSYDTNEVTIHFANARGLQPNTDVLFRGYSVGRVISVAPPALLVDIDQPDQQYYQVVVVIAIEPEYHIPANVKPKVYPRGLGSSYIGLVLDEPPATRLLQAHDKLKGSLSEASEFISEGTQRKLDGLLASLMELVTTLQGQLVSLPPEQVDQADPNLVQPNITTAVMRADEVLKNLNIFLDDPANQQNFKQGMADFAALSGRIHNAIKTAEDVAEEVRQLVRSATRTVDKTQQIASEANQACQRTAARIQNAADELARASGAMSQLFSKVSSGDGTAGRLVNDPRLYEALTDAGRNLELTLQELRRLIADWKQDGLKVDLK